MNRNLNRDPSVQVREQNMINYVLHTLKVLARVRILGYHQLLRSRCHVRGMIEYSEKATNITIPGPTNTSSSSITTITTRRISPSPWVRLEIWWYHGVRMGKNFQEIRINSFIPSFFTVDMSRRMIDELPLWVRVLPRSRV